ncbi:MAG: DnaJ domain-containing protein [Nitrospiria bacterium]
MGDANPSKKFSERKHRLKRHLVELKKSLQHNLAYAFDRYYEDQILTYLSVEEKIDRLEALFLKLDDQIDAADNMVTLRQTAGRVDYVADRLDALEAALHQRARRRGRSPFRFADFFSRFTQQNGNSSSPARGEISSLTEAYQTLNLEEGTGLTEVTTAFRRLAKKYHPDARGGDRSAESQLRRVVESYQIIKETFTTR